LPINHRTLGEKVDKRVGGAILAALVGVADYPHLLTLANREVVPRVPYLLSHCQPGTAPILTHRKENTMKRLIVLLPPMKRWAILAALGCSALLAALIMSGVGPMAPPAAADAGIFSIFGYVWDDADVDGLRDGGEGAPNADVELHLCPGDDAWGCRDVPGIASTSIDANGYYEFPDLYGDDTPYTVCLDITPSAEWTLDMVREWGVAVDPGDVSRRCFTTLVGTGAPTLDWGVVHIASALSVSKVCSPTSLDEGDIECTITVSNEGETILYGAYDAGVLAEDYYRCGDFDLADADPAPDESGEDEGWCWAVWDVGYLDPGDQVTIDITLSPKHTTGTARNCNHGAALNVNIPLVFAQAGAANIPVYGAYWEDVYAPDRCVSFGEPERHRRSTPTPTAKPTATPTVPSPPPTATMAPPPAPTATPSGGVGPLIAPPATGEGPSGHGGQSLWLWALGGAGLAAVTGWLAQRRVRSR
jgi:hypothetical protein